jgi:hypothetical protein
MTLSDSVSELSYSFIVKPKRCPLRKDDLITANLNFGFAINFTIPISGDIP